MKPVRGLGPATWIVRAAAQLAPAHWRERVRREWEAELAAEAARGEGGARLLLSALGAFADVSALRGLDRASGSSGRETMAGVMSGTLRETKVAVRSLLRSPAYTVVAVVTLGLGLGGSAAIYTLLDQVVLDPLPYPEPDRLVRVQNVVEGESDLWNASTAQYVFFTDHARTLESVGLYNVGGANVQTPEGAERVRSATVTAEVFDLLGARARLGRLMTSDDILPSTPSVVVLSHAFWTRALGAESTVVGRTINLNDGPAEVIGVLEPGHELPDTPPGFATDVWRPLKIDRAGDFYNSHVYRMVGRLAEGADTLSAEAEIAQLTPRLTEAFPRAYSRAFLQSGFSTVAIPLKASVLGDAARNLWIVFGGVGLVLFIACANVANLFLVRMEARRREIAVRAALGAGRGQVARYLVAEGLVLAGTGAALALLISHQALRVLPAIGLEGLPRMNGIALDGGTVLFTVALALFVAAALALQPLVVHSRAQAARILGEAGRTGSGGPSGSRFRAALVVIEVATAMVLAVSAGLLVKSMGTLTIIDPGVRADGVVTMEVNLTQARYPDDFAVWSFHSQALDRLRNLPGVLAAGMSAELPLQDGFGCTVQGFDDPTMLDRLNARGVGTCAGQEPTTPGYFEAMGIPLVSGRLFENADNDDPSRAALVVSQAFAELFWPGEDPLGKRVAPNGRDRGFYTVVGVVGDVPAATVEGERAIAVYYPIVQEPTARQYWWPGAMRLVVKTGLADPQVVVPAIRQAIAEVDPTVPLANVRAMQDVIDASMARLSFTALLLAIAAGTALLLAAVGLYGVVSYAVTRRQREIGMRMAIGANARQVEWMVVSQTLGLASVGLAIGVGVSLAATRVLRGLLYGVDPTEPAAFAAAALLMLTVAVLASWIPARRASRVDPSEALRSD